MTLKAHKTAHTRVPPRQRAKVLGRSPLTGTRVLEPVSKGAKVTVDQVRRALATLDPHATK